MGAILLLLAALVAPRAPAHAVPTPIGIGPGFRPAATTPWVRGGRPLGSLRCTEATEAMRVHVELFVHGRALLLPAGIGVAAPSARSGAVVEPRGCRYPLSTLDPTGVIDITAGRVYTLGDVFRIWQQPLGRHRLLGFRSHRAVRVFVNGRRWHGPPAAVRLQAHDEIVVELGPLVPPHRSYLFPEQP